MTLYKFRPLGTCQDLERAQDILETGRFWCSRFWELNDPMEGVYWFNAGTLTKEFIRKLYGEKSRYAICSFSGVNAFSNPLVWGYYANGFKGIAIEIDANCRKTSITQMNYASEVANIRNGDKTADAVKRILTTKLCCWKHEDEYRYLCNGETGPRKIGRITAVYFGNPYNTIGNRRDVQHQPHVRQYLCRVRLLKRTARNRKIDCHDVEIDDGRVGLAKSNAEEVPTE